MQPQRKSDMKGAPAADAGLDRDDVEHILSTFEEDGKVTRKGTRAAIMDIYDRMRFQGGAYQSPIEPAPGFDPAALQSLPDHKAALLRQVARGIWDVPDARLPEVERRVAAARDLDELEAVRHWMRDEGM